MYELVAGSAVGPAAGVMNTSSRVTRGVYFLQKIKSRGLKSSIKSEVSITLRRPTEVQPYDLWHLQKQEVQAGILLNFKGIVTLPNSFMSHLDPHSPSVVDTI